ncbi:DUF4760 domain-containing protein [Actinobacillus equuli subsp. equuli]|uniref:DUF4760 domain-containing protein n=2 Tax=Actinobacillus equuli TaxID=718 RepID=A0A9X4JDA5_ACTEU|nr:DUF4760 domain-containing protein [Actinobacillus equuli]MDE8035637.1 DUF4760 domain-containing protein [Actinobacillus equuli subsp. equuli]WGE41837.1 DUF4760 domain-containing protein [Actinobacillus equuli subsp. haemolyticus]WGE72995.1 DUF4760 domain-containing protein [Actinobacillus equuli subsp. haemolyticus]
MVSFRKIYSQIRKGGLTLCISLIALFLALYLLMKQYQFTIDTSKFSITDWATLGQLVVISITAIIAIYTILSNRKTSKERATLDVVLDDYKDDKLVVASNEVFNIVREDRNKLYTVFQNENNQYTEQRQRLLLVLNRYEFYASAMNHGILDEKLFKRLHCSNFIKLWDAVSPTVMSIRDKERKDTLFKDLEILVLRWKSSPLTSDDL